MVVSNEYTVGLDDMVAKTLDHEACLRHAASGFAVFYLKVAVLERVEADAPVMQSANESTLGKVLRFDGASSQ